MAHVRRILSLILLTLISCSPGYQKEDDDWVWVTYDEAAGKRITKIDSVDAESFRILPDEEYAMDKNRVYLNGIPVSGADPNTFEALANGYSRDKNNVFLDCDRVVFANPETFELIRFPFSRDDSHIFCGTVPLIIDKDEISSFEVTEPDKLGYGMKSSMTLSYFIESYPEYEWIDTVGVKGVIIGEWATGETRNSKFRGLYKSSKMTNDKSSE